MQDGIRNQTGRELDGGKEEVGLREIRRTWERGSHAHGRRCRVKGWVIRAAAKVRKGEEHIRIGAQTKGTHEAEMLGWC